MAFPRLSSSVLLASVLLLLYWTTSSAQSRDLTSSALSLPHRVKRDLAFEDREKTRASFEFVSSILSVFKDVSEAQQFEESTKDVLKKLSKFASLAPGCVGVIFSVVNLALAATSQHDPVLAAVKEGFAEVNRKLDSLSIQMSNLATDVEWFNYASVYSQDELHIVNAWRKFNEFVKQIESTQSEEEKLRLAEIFTNYYEYTGTESSVSNLYHYLTTSSTSLSKNLNELLKKKFKCDIRKIGRYNFYFSTLLLNGIVLNEAYWKLIGLTPPNSKAKHAEMFTSVYRSQFAAVVSCVNNYKDYVRNDVLEISKALSPDDKQVIAERVKKALDKKYDWYEWVVLVYDTEEDGSYLLYDLTKIPVGKVTVAVDYKVKGEPSDLEHVKGIANSCFQGEYCENLKTDSNKCRSRMDFYQPGTNEASMKLKDYVRAVHVIYRSNFVELPAPFYTHGCSWGQSTSQIYMHYSMSLAVCHQDGCQNGGRCMRLGDSNDNLCECQDGYYGDSCEERMDTSLAELVNARYPVPTITSTNGRLKVMEVKLQQLINNRCGG